MAWTQSDLDTLDAALLALAGGAKTIRYNNREVTKYDLSDLLELRAAMATTLQAANGSACGYRVAATSKGLY